MKLTSREKSYIIVALTVAFCSMFISYLILPQRDKYFAAKQAIAQAKNQLSHLKSVNNSAGESEGQRKKMSVDMSVYTRQLPVRPETAELLYYLNLAAQSTGVELQLYEEMKSESGENQTNGGQSGSNTDKGKPKHKTGIIALPGRMRVMGSYKQIRAFLGKTEQLQRIVHNKSLVINDIPQLQKLECIIEFEAFYKPDEIFVTENKDVPSALTGKQTLFKY